MPAVMSAPSMSSARSNTDSCTAAGPPPVCTSSMSTVFSPCPALNMITAGSMVNDARAAHAAHNTHATAKILVFTMQLSPFPPLPFGNKRRRPRFGRLL